MIYVMSDIHGCARQLEDRLDQLDIKKGDKVIFLGDYIDYGPSSADVLRIIIRLQKTWGEETVIALKGNHEDRFLSWMDECRQWNKEDYLMINDWLKDDLEKDGRVFRTLVTQDQWEEFHKIEGKASDRMINTTAVRMIKETSMDLVRWIRNLPPYHETERQIFVHAGIEEEAEEFWITGTPDHVFMWKYPPTRGAFYKTIIAGHTGTHNLAQDDAFHSIYYDGESHYYIDGTVYDGGQLCLMAYDDREDVYYEIDHKGIFSRIPAV